jgi:hypothetical protein
VQQSECLLAQQEKYANHTFHVLTTMLFHADSTSHHWYKLLVIHSNFSSLIFDSSAWIKWWVAFSAMQWDDLCCSRRDISQSKFT